MTTYIGELKRHPDGWTAAYYVDKWWGPLFKTYLKETLRNGGEIKCKFLKEEHAYNALQKEIKKKVREKYPPKSGITKIFEFVEIDGSVMPGILKEVIKHKI